MDQKVIIDKVNEIYCRIDAPNSILMEISDKFSFYAQGYKFHPKFKAKLWDGKIRLFNARTSTIYMGLLDKIEEFCQERNYEIEITFEQHKTPITPEDFDTFLETLSLPFELRDYQKKSAIDAIRNRRRILLSPTASGKSLIIYSIIRFLNLKTLLIVPTTSLVDQMRGDFMDYSINNGWDVDAKMALVMAGKEKEVFPASTQIVCTTWQSIYKLDKSWFTRNNFDIVILDEAHHGKAASITSIMEKLPTTKYRIGTTGTLDDIPVHELTLHGLFGKPTRVVDTQELIASKHLSEMTIKCIIFSHGEEAAKRLPKDYQDELDFIVSSPRRNNFIANLAISAPGNSLVLYNLVGRHGKILFDIIEKKSQGKKKVFFISGDIDSSIRETIRKTVEEEGKDCIIVASLGTFSTGVNIINLHNIFFAHPTKAKIKLLQSIGRGLRKRGAKTHCTFYDFADDLRVKSRKNYTYVHFMQRIKIYLKESFQYKLYKVDLSKDKE